jgi:catechol 2,3-dioxygenase-like lactoylglutathione lyase family enzyme
MSETQGERAGVTVLGFNHMSFTVGDLDRMVAFLVDGLGFRLMARGPRDPRLIERMTGIAGAAIEIAFVEAAGQRIELIRYLSPPGRAVIESRLCDTGSAHVGLDVDDLDEAVATARRYEFDLVGDIIRPDAGPNRGRRVCYMRNDEGITIEFLEIGST